MGGLVQVSDTKWQPFTGGKPNVAYDALEAPVQLPVHNGQYRGLGTEDTKGLAVRTVWPHPKITKQSSPVKTKELLQNFFEQHGLDTVTYIVINGVVRSVINESDKFTAAEAKQEYTSLSQKRDSYCQANDLAAAKLFLNAVDTTLWKDVTMFHCASGAAGFIPYWLSYLSSTNDANYDKRQKLESELRAIKVTNYPQQNLSDMIEDVKLKCDLLTDIGGYDHQNSVAFMENFAEAGDSIDVHMLSFRTTLIGKVKTTDLLEYVRKEYKTLFDNGKWAPAKNLIDSKAPSINVASTESAKPKPDMTAVALHALKALMRLHPKTGSTTT